MTGKPGPTSVQACAVFWAVHLCRPSASCWCSGGRNPNPKRPRLRCGGANPLPPNGRPPRARRLGRRASRARHPARRPIQGGVAWRSVRPRACRPAHLVRPAQREAREPAQEAPVRAPVRSARLHERVRATDPQHREAKQRPAPAQHAFARHRVESPAARSILQRDPRPARAPRNSNGPCAEWHSEVAHLEHLIAAQPARGLHLGGIALKLADQGT